MLNKRFFTLFIFIVSLSLTACNGDVQVSVATASQPPAGGQTTASLSSSAIQPATPLGDKLSNASPDGDGSVTITISDDELTQLISTAQAAAIARGHTPVFQDAIFTFTNGQIIFSSTIDSDRFSGDAEIIFTPYLTDNVLQFELVSATVNGRPVPPTALSSVEATINSALQEAFSQLPPNISLDEVTIQEGTLIISGSVQR